MFEPLDPVAVRVLGALIEKEFTTPDNYPLTLNALTTACNQTSNRDPVMDLDEGTVSRTLNALAQRSLARGVHRGDSRVMRYRQEISDAFHLHKPELAALCVLLLRGPQTVGEIRTRTARMAEFPDLRHVEITLDSLATLPTPLVTQLPRRPGQKETRYTHLLAGEPADSKDEAAGGAFQAAPESTRPASSSDRARPLAAAERIEALEQQVSSLRGEVAELREQLEAFRRQFE
jgi:uncharacterized protein YceH (UPF0502 family)